MECGGVRGVLGFGGGGSDGRVGDGILGSSTFPYFWFYTWDGTHGGWMRGSWGERWGEESERWGRSD